MRSFLTVQMASPLVKGLRQCKRIWMFCAILGVLVQMSAAADRGMSKRGACSGVTLENLKAAPCTLGGADITVTYRNRKLSCGAVEPKQGVADEPKFVYAKAEKKKKYTLMMLDANAPNHGDLYYRHWLIADIEGDDLIAGNINNGRLLTEYTPPTPPQGSGVHHYQFFVMEQTGGEVKAPKSKGKAKFDAVDYCGDSGLCGPVAAFEFLTEF